MTTIVYEEKFIRTSIDDLFPIEWTERWNFVRSVCQPILSGTEEIINEQKVWSISQAVDDPLFSNLLKIEYAEFINWDGIFDREDELRPDLKLFFNQIKHLYPVGNPSRIRYGPPFNPFSLTLTGLFTFKTFEGFEASYNNYNTEQGSNQLVTRGVDDVINNQYVERLLIDNIEYDYPFLSTKIRSIYGK